MNKENMEAALKALEKLDLHEVKAVREVTDVLAERLAVKAAGGGADYPRAQRECLIDCQAFLQSARKGRLTHEHMGQLDVLLTDLNNLIHREDVPNYSYKKGT
jgi:hypothetical protein